MKRLCRRRGVWRYVGGMIVCAACVLFLASGLRGQAGRTGTVSVESARVRAEASTSSDIAGSLASGDTVDVIGETESGGSTWYQVQYTQDGEQVTGWLRSDLLSVSGTEEETPDGEEPGETGEIETPDTQAAYTIQEPEEACPEASSLLETTIEVGDGSFTAWQADADTALYLVWASAADGSAGWYWYDPVQGTFQQNLGQFSSEGLVTALQNELTELKVSSAEALSMRLYIIIGLGVLGVILLVLVIVLALRLRNAEYEYYDDDEEDDGEEDEDAELEKPRKRGGLFGRRREEEDGDFDDFVAAVGKKREKGGAAGAEDESYDEELYEEEPEEKLDLTLTANLPQIDMSAVEEVEKTAVPGGKKPQKGQDEEDEDFDIEILDFDDLDL